MAINIAPKSLDTELSELMREVSSGKEQLPEFQRGWTWDNDRIRGIIASLSQGYPMGAIMRLEYGNENVRFKYRTIEGVTVTGVTPEFLILDGQQRLTSMYRATCCKEPVETMTEKGKKIKRYYYLDIKGSLRNVGVVKSICKQKQTAAYQSSNHGISATGGFTSHGYSCRNRVSFVN